MLDARPPACHLAGMREIAPSSAAAILAIPPADPERLFTSPAAARDEFRALARRWHPDQGGEAAVFAHLARLWDAAERKIAEGLWRAVRLTGRDGVERRLRYRARRDTGFGEVFVGDRVAAFVLPEGCTDLLEGASRLIAGLHHADAAMEREFARQLPRPRAAFEAADGRAVLVVEKTPDLFLLADLLEAMGGRMDPRHVGWLLNRAYSLACWLDWAGLTHNALGAETLFVSPGGHGIALLGGWWCAAPAGAPVPALPAPALRYVTAAMREEGPDGRQVICADGRLDLELVRALGRRLLGDETGTSFPRDRPAPDPMLRFLRAPSTGDARQDHRDWSQRVLPDCFGPPRFVELRLGAREIYGEE